MKKSGNSNKSLERNTKREIRETTRRTPLSLEAGQTPRTELEEGPQPRDPLNSNDPDRHRRKNPEEVTAVAPVQVATKKLELLELQ